MTRPNSRPPIPKPVELLSLDVRASAQELTDRGLSVRFTRGRRRQLTADIINATGARLFHANSEPEFHAYVAGLLAGVNLCNESKWETDPEPGQICYA